MHDREKHHTTPAADLLSYTEAGKLVGKTYWQLKYAVQKDKIKTVPVAGRVALLRDSVLEFAGQK
jgi:hypothetical protein